MNTEQLIKIGFDETHDMCEACGDAVATSRSRGYEVCTDCYVEMGV